MAFPFIHIEQLTVQRNEQKLLDHIDLTILHDEQWVITGPSGSGKTTLAHALSGMLYFSGKIVFNGIPDYHPHIVVVEQQHRFKNLSNTTDFYYQQRYNASDAENALTVTEALDLNKYAPSVLRCGISINALPALLHIEHVMQEPLIQLSNGENKRLQIARAILSDPELLILDNPFMGLDTEGRATLAQVINTLNNAGVKIILITPPNEIPQCITHVATLENGKLISAVSKKEFHLQATANTKGFRMNLSLLPLFEKPAERKFENAIKMINVQVKYGERLILKDINWEVKRGERWSISGPNGAGKSTLLSLITGDNTKAYANEIYLFDKRRGSGESIWDIKKKIGYVSPEMHVFFDYSATCFETVASGLFDSIGLFRTLNSAQQQQIRQWLALFNLQAVQSRRLSLLSTGEQRLALLARALVKNPPLLILDEPCQGLDPGQVRQFKQIINEICILFDATLLYVSHYKEEIPECVTHFMKIENGQAAFTQAI